MKMVKFLSVVLLIIAVCSSVGGATFRFTASADNRPYQSENVPRWEWLLDEITDKVVDEGVFHVMPVIP